MPELEFLHISQQRENKEKTETDLNVGALDVGHVGDEGVGLQVLPDVHSGVDDDFGVADVVTRGLI